MRVLDALIHGVGVLNGFSPSARLDAEVLLAHALQKPVTFLLAHDDSRMPLLAWWRYRRLVRKRKTGIPVVYLTGRKEFYFLDFDVTPDVLIPRPDTEILVDEVVDYMNYELRITNYELNKITEGAIPQSRERGFGSSPSVILLDVGTGSGCIPISVLKNVEGVEAIATDISGKALRVARRNAKKHGVGERIRFIESDLLGSVPAEFLYDREVVVTANLPYVPEGYPVTPAVYFEPRVAVYAGSDGLDVYRRFCVQITNLRPRAIFLEALEQQIPVLRQMFIGYDSRVIKNLSGECRFVVFERRK